VVDVEVCDLLIPMLDLKTELLGDEDRAAADVFAVDLFGDK
jgi:hypothetical protein